MESGHDVGNSSSVRRVLKSRPKTLVPRCRLGLKKRVGSQWIAGSIFEYEASFDDEIVNA